MTLIKPNGQKYFEPDKYKDCDAIGKYKVAILGKYLGCDVETFEETKDYYDQIWIDQNGESYKVEAEARDKPEQWPSIYCAKYGQFRLPDRKFVRGVPDIFVSTLKSWNDFSYIVVVCKGKLKGTVRLTTTENGSGEKMRYFEHVDCDRVTIENGTLVWDAALGRYMLSNGNLIEDGHLNDPTKHTFNLT